MKIKKTKILNHQSENVQAILNIDHEDNVFVSWINPLKSDLDLYDHAEEMNDLLEEIRTYCNENNLNLQMY